MFGISEWELVVICIVLLICVGPKNIPVMMRKIGKVIGDFKMASRDLRNQFETEVRAIEKEIISPTQEIKAVAQEALERTLAPYRELEEADRRFREELKEQVITEKRSYEQAAKDKAALPYINTDARGNNHKSDLSESGPLQGGKAS